MRHCPLILFAFVIGCTSNEPSPVPAVTDYFPLKKGAFLVYSVDSVVVSQNVETPFHYDMKTQVTDSFATTTGVYTYVIQRSKRMSSSSPWTAMESWSARVDQFQAVVNEGNTPYIKINGTLTDGRAWDGNALNILGGNEKCIDHESFNCDIYTLADFKKPFKTTAGTTFENTLTIIQNDNKDIVSQDKRLEIYAAKIGLVYREITALTYCTSNPSCVGTQFVTTGLKFKQMIGDYGGL